MAITATPTISSPTGVTTQASASPKLNIVEQYYRDKAIEEATRSKEQSQQLEGAIVLGGSLVATYSFLKLKPEQALLVLLGEIIGLGIFKAVKDNVQPQPTPTPRVIHADSIQ